MENRFQTTTAKSERSRKIKTGTSPSVTTGLNSTAAEKSPERRLTTARLAPQVEHSQPKCSYQKQGR